MVDQNNSGFTPSAPKGNDDLYAQIAAGDNAEQKQARAKSSFVMNLMIEYMRLTLLIDSKRRQYQKLFRALAGIWAVLMLLLYVAGGTMLTLLIGSYMRFPTEIQKYMKDNGILYTKMDIPGYVISQVELKGLHDKGNTYQIDSLSISSTFADFLNRRARSVSAKGVKLTVDTSLDGRENFLLALAKLRQGGNTQSGLRIDSLKVENAAVTLKGKDYSLPVTMSLTGVYGNETNITGHIEINEPSLKIKGPLTIRSVGDGLQWNLNIANGQIAFPGRPLEKLQGEFGCKTKERELTSLTADLSLFFNQLRRDVSVNLKQKNGLFAGKLSLKWLESANTPKPVEQVRLDFDLGGLKISTDGTVQTKEPLQMSLTSNYSPNLKVTALAGTLNGELSCQLFDTCSYYLDKPAILATRKITVRDQGYEVNNKSRFQFTLLPTQKLIDVAFKTGRVEFDFNTKDFVFNGEQAGTRRDVSLKARKGRATGHLNLWDKDVSSVVSLDGMFYQNPTIDLKQGSFVSDNIFDDNARFFLSSPWVVLAGNTAVKVPFALSYDREKGQANILASLENKRIQLLFSGAFDWNSGYVNGQMVVPTIDLASLRQPLNRLSDLISPDFQGINGKIAAYGRVSGNLYSELRGPFYISLNDLGFKTDKLQILHLNTVLTAQSLVPFVTDSEQKVYIGKIDSFIPISDVDITLKAEDSYAQVKELSANVAGIRLGAGETVVPYKNIGTLIYLRNQDDNLTNIVQENQLKEWKNNGPVRGSVLFPVEIKDMSLSIKNAILQLFGSEFQYVGSDQNKPSFLGQNTKISINSGTITIDTSDKKDEGNKISVMLDSVLLPSKLKKTIREVYWEKLSDVVKFKTNREYKVLPELQRMIHHIQEQTDKFRVK